MHIQTDRSKVLSVFTLVMINVIAVDSLRSLPISAEYGTSIVFFYLLGAIIFFIPIALISAELATGWPRTGGLYVWVREAFGPRWGFTAIWLQWIYNVVWYPTILSFIAATMAYIINPSLADNNIYMISIALVIFWIATLANCFGMRLSGLVSTLGTIFGTLLPMLFIIILGIFWLFDGKTTQIAFSWHSFLPDLSSINNLAFFVAILFGLIGLEMSAVHAEEVKDPARDYPRALLYSAVIILVTLTLASLAIAMVVPHENLNVISGLMEAYDAFFTTFHIAWMSPIMACLIILGAFCSVSAWVIGPTKGLLTAAEDGCLPKLFQKTNRRGVPVPILLIQAVIFTLLCTIFLLVPSVTTSYWILSALTAQLAMLVYVFMFAAAVRLRYNRPDIHRAYRIPFGNVGMWIVGAFGLLTCSFAIIIGFFPPPEIHVRNVHTYVTLLTIGMLIFCVSPLLLYRTKGVKS